MIHAYIGHDSCSRHINVLNNIQGINWFIIDLLLLASNDHSIINKQAIHLIKEGKEIWCAFIYKLVNFM